MTSEQKDMKAVVHVFLLISVLFFGCGCDGGLRPSPQVDRVGTVSSERTEGQLLAELSKKFENPQAHYELARLYHQSQQWNKAEYRYNVALGFQPGFKAAQAGLVKMFGDQGETAKAEQYANSYIRQATVAVGETLRLAWEFEKLGLNEFAERAFGQALAAAPDSADANREAGLYYLGRGDSGKAKQYLLRSFELNPRQPDVAGALGRLGVVVETPGMAEGSLERRD